MLDVLYMQADAHTPSRCKNDKVLYLMRCPDLFHRDIDKVCINKT